VKIILTGSAGYIGSLVHHYLSDSVSNFDIESIDLDLGTDIENVKDRDCDVLIHLAAYTSVIDSYTEHESYYHNNCSKLHKFLMLNNNRFKYIIYSSSGAIYPDRYEINPESVYGSTKLEGEFLVKRTGIPHSILRFANPVGVVPQIHKLITKKITSSYPNVMIGLTLSKLRNQIFHIHKSSNMTRDFYPVSWIAKIILAIIQRGGIEGTFDLGSGIPTNVNSLLIKICNEFSIDYDFIPPPPGVGLGFKIDFNKFKLVSDLLEHEFIDYNPVDYCLSQFPNYLETFS